MSHREAVRFVGRVSTGLMTVVLIASPFIIYLMGV